jgi:hypothetical protein
MENEKKVAKIEASSDETHLLLYGRILQQLRHSFRAHNMQSSESNISEHHSYVELLTEKQLSMAIYTLQATMEVMTLILLLLILWTTHLDGMMSIAGSKLEPPAMHTVSYNILVVYLHILYTHIVITA